jgi:hypothetical protein
MTESTREQVFDALQNGWGTCVARFQRLSVEAQATFLAKQGYARLADLLAHVVAWWQEAQRAIENWLVDPTFDPPRYDVDAFNAQAVASVRDLDEPAVTAVFEAARRALLAFVAGLPDEAFENQRIVERLQIEVVGHLEEHEMAP